MHGGVGSRLLCEAGLRKYGDLKMRNLNLAKLAATTALATALIPALPAYAQDAEPAPATPEVTGDAAQRSANGDDTPQGAIVVTGSRIARPELESTVPVTNFGGEDIYKQSTPNLGEALNELPALRSTYSQSNPELGIGIAGLNLLDLRGLGIQRTLVLVNGRRHVPTDIQATASAVDINTIPSALVDRVDIVTGGSSALYGSDAIAGVVNFVMKDSYEGLSIRGGAGLPDYAAGGNQFLSAIAGTNFADNRGNIAVAFEFTNQERLFASQVPWRRNSYGYVTVDTDSTPGDGVIDRRFETDIRNTTIARTGLVPFLQPAPNEACGGLSLSGVPYNCDYIFQADGSLVPVTFEDRVGTGYFGSYIGGNSETGNEGRQVSVYPQSERYIGNILGKFEFSSAAEVFFEGKFARSHVIGSNSGPAFNQGQFITFLDNRARLRLDNPFLQDQARATITEQLLASGINNDLVPVFGGLTDGTEDFDGDGLPDTQYNDIADIAAGTYRFAIAKSFEDLGIRDEDATRDTYRAVLGMRGEFAPDWTYEIAGVYGRTNEKIKVLGNVNVQRLMLALDAGINPDTGQIQCRSQFDPNAAYQSPDVDEEGGAATLAGDIAACVPYNPFGLPDNRAAANYIVSDSGSKGHLEQIDVSAFIAGNSSKWFELPGGPISMVVGAEYRRENAYFKADDVINSGLTFLNALQTFDPDPTTVYEGFGEIDIPLLADRPFFEELGVTAAGRLSDYGGATGQVFAWNVGGRWSPVRDVTFRVNYGKAVRAPNYTETASPFSENFASLEDPCADARRGANPNREANCAADLGGNLNNAGYQGKVAGVYSLETLSGANPNLTEESSKSLTIGAVFQPRFVPGLSVTVDYYNIKVSDVIVNVGAQTIVDQCYDLASLDNQFCAQFERNAGPGLGPKGEQPGEILSGSLIEGPLNFARRERSGIDVDVSYGRQIGNDTFLRSRLYYTHVIKASNFTDPTDPDFEDVIRGELGDPKNEAKFSADLTMGKVTLGYGARYIGEMYLGPYENYFPLNGLDPQNPDAYPRRTFPEVVYHDLRAAVQVDGVAGSRSGEFYLGADNVFDKKPPLSATGLTANSSIYDVWGRRFYVGFRADF